MPSMVTRIWEPPGQRPRRFKAFVPDQIADVSLALSGQTLQQSEKAAMSLARVDGYLPVAWRPIARLLLRAEGLASSDIEGLRVSPRRLLLAADRPTDLTARWVVGNLEALDFALSTTTRELSVSLINQWHRRLMLQSPLPSRYVGRLRIEQGWIGGISPLDAVYVPPPPELVRDLMEDLVAFGNRVDLPTIVQAAMAHAQFETIHPYGDGNGRVGRILVDWILRRGAVVNRAIPPLSLVIARRPDDYIVGLFHYRQGEIEDWIAWFSQICIDAFEVIHDLVGRVERLIEEWQHRLVTTRSHAAAHRLLELLPGTPLVDAGTAARAAGVTRRAALAALAKLEAAGILEPIEPSPTGSGRPQKRWLAPEVLKLLSR